MTQPLDMKTTFGFDDTARDFVLEAFNKKIDVDDYLVEAKAPFRRVLTKDGQEIKAHQFAGVMKGSEIYIKSDIVSLIQLCEALEPRV